MPLQYLNYNDGEVYGDPIGASRFSFKLAKDRVEQTLEFEAYPGTKGYTRIIWSGSFAYQNQKLSTISITDLTFTQGGDALNSTSWSVHFSTPQTDFPSGIENATKINYHYSSSGTGSTTDRSGGGYDLFKSFPVSTNRGVTEGYAWSSRIREDWWKMPFEDVTSATSTDLSNPLEAPTSYGANKADIITNYNPKTDEAIQIGLATFDGAVGKLNIAKKTKQVAKHAKKDIDFIYDQQAGYLYYNENGKEAGFGDGGIFAILEGKPKVGLGNFEFV